MFFSPFFDGMEARQNRRSAQYDPWASFFGANGCRQQSRCYDDAEGSRGRRRREEEKMEMEVETPSHSRSRQQAPSSANDRKAKQQELKRAYLARQQQEDCKRDTANRKAAQQLELRKAKMARQEEQMRMKEEQMRLRDERMRKEQEAREAREEMRKRKLKERNMARQALRDAKLGRAATTIQAAFRGHRVRKMDVIGQLKKIATVRQRVEALCVEFLEKMETAQVEKRRQLMIGLEDAITREGLLALDSISTNGSAVIRGARKQAVQHMQKLLAEVERMDVGDDMMEEGEESDE